MTDTATVEPTATIGQDWASPKARANVRRRYGADRRLQIYGIMAILASVAMLFTLFGSLIYTGSVAFSTTKLDLGIFLDPNKIDASAPEKANYRALVRGAYGSYFPEVTSRADQRQLHRMLSAGAQYIVRDYVVANPDKIGQLVKVQVPFSDPFDQLYKGVIPRQIEALSKDRIALYRRLEQRNVVKTDGGQAIARVEAFVDPGLVNASDIANGNFRAIVYDSLESYFSGERTTNYREIVTRDAQQVLLERVVNEPSLIGKTVTVDLPLSENYANLAREGRAMVRNPRFSSDQEFTWFDSLVERDLVSSPFTYELFTNADSRFPELAGLAGALTGTALALLVCFLLSFPIGIAAAVYLEEFAPKNRISDIIEVNINNLAAVPSVVFGLLGLAVFINAFGLPRSAPLVGGMVLALMTLPTIIVATRAALKSVPPSIREAALGVGASRHQVMFHHVLPLAMPGILTGTIIGLAQALGETAPLLLIGMNAFIPSIENMGVLEPAMALPTQIFSWADSPERGFVTRTSAAILVLLGFLIIMNILAVILRSRLERKW